MKKRSLNLRSPLLLIFSVAAALTHSPLQAAPGTWNQTAAGTAYSWTDSANWLPATGFPSGVGDEASVNANIAGNQTISLNAPITLGILRLGDAGTSGFFAQTLAAGNGGSLTFDATGDNVQLIRASAANNPPVNPNLSDFINAPVSLQKDLTVVYPWVNSGNGIQVNGLVSGPGSITLTGVNYQANGSGMVQFLDLTNPANTFTGSVKIANGALVYRGDVGISTNSALGNSSTPILIGTAESLVGSGSPTLANTTTAELRLQALDDTSNYGIARDLEFSNNPGGSPAVGRARFTLTGNNAGVPNTNTVTLTGTVTLPSSTRGSEFLAVRQGQTIRFAGPIITPPSANGTIYWGPQGPGLSTADGRNTGTIRFSEDERTYSNPQNLTGGTIVIEGTVGLTGFSSPIGTTTFSLGDGNGGNIFSANTEGATRRLFLTQGGSSFERPLAFGAGSGTNMATAANINAVLPAVYQALYGNSGSLNAMNGYEFGGLNDSGTIVFTQPLTANNVNLPITGTAAGLGGTNAWNVVHNIALTAATGGSVEFRGNITGATPPALGDTLTPGAVGAANLTRITINQFRNHPNLDLDVNGVPDAGANRPVGVPTGGTVILSGSNTYGGSTEVMGGTLRLDYSGQDFSKLSDTAPLILSGGTLNVHGGTHIEIVESTILTAGTANTITQTDNAAPPSLRLITAQPGGSVDFAAAGIATTDTFNTNGILGPWATINNTDFAVNSTNAFDGPITAYTAYTDVTRKASGTKVIANNAALNLRIVEGTGADGALTLAAASTVINTLNQSSTGGAGASTINGPGQTLDVNAILAASGTGGLTVNTDTLRPAAAGGSLIIRNVAANPVRISAVIADNTTAGGLSLAGTGTTILTNANTYTGNTIIQGSTLQLGVGTTDGSLASQAVINHGALIYSLLGDQTYPGIISGTGSLTKNGIGSLILTGANAGTGSVTITEGTLQLGDGGANGALAGGALLTNNGIFRVNRSSATTQGTEFPRVISGTGGVTKEGTGTLTFSGANTYAGVTTVTAGPLAISHPTGLGTTAGNTVINSNGTVTTGGRVVLSNNITVAEDFTIEGSGDGSPPTPSYNGAITATSGNNTITGTITLTGNATYRLTANNTGTVMNYGLIQREGSAGNLTLDPSVGATLIVNQALQLNGGALTCHAGGLVILNAPDNNIGNTAVQNGTSLRIGASEALGTNRNLQIGQGVTNGANGVNNDVGTFDLAGKNQTINALIGAANAGTAVPNNATPANRRLITSSQPGPSLLTLGNGGASGSFDGLIQNGAGVVSLTKTGVGTQTLTGPNTYTGDTSINSGILRLGAATNLADSSAVRIDNSGSILQLADGVTDTVAALYIDGESKTGTWGSTSSEATNKDDEHFAGTGILNVSGTAVDAYTAWATSFGLQNPWSGTNPLLNGNPTADPDGDGRSNRQEFIFGLSPVSGASSQEITVPPGQTAGLFTYSRRLPSLSGATFRYQWSTSLTGTWTDFTPASLASNNGATIELVTVGIPASLLTNTRLFVRVLVP